MAFGAVAKEVAAEQVGAKRKRVEEEECNMPKKYCVEKKYYIYNKTFGDKDKINYEESLRSTRLELNNAKLCTFDAVKNGIEKKFKNNQTISQSDYIMKDILIETFLKYVERSDMMKRVFWGEILQSLKDVSVNSYKVQQLQIDIDQLEKDRRIETKKEHFKSEKRRIYKEYLKNCEEYEEECTEHIPYSGTDHGKRCAKRVTELNYKKEAINSWCHKALHDAWQRIMGDDSSHHEMPSENKIIN